MYRCCNIKHFLHLLIVDAIVIALLALFVNTSGCFDTSGAEKNNIELYIIMYHSITEKENGEYSVSPQTLESDLEWLKTNGYSTVLPSDLVDYAGNKVLLSKKSVMLTFDDGFYNNLYYALPLLEKYNYSAVISVVGEYTDINAQKDPNVADYSYLTWENINELIASKRIEIGNHTYSMHNSISRMGAEKLVNETEEEYAQMLYADVFKLQKQMYEKTGYVPICFAYPYGHISRESVPVLRKLGFLVTLGCQEKKNTVAVGDFDSLYSLGRFNRPGNVSTERFMQSIFQ